jgi:hypothetical protein
MIMCSDVGLEVCSGLVKDLRWGAACVRGGAKKEAPTDDQLLLGDAAGVRGGG